MQKAIRKVLYKILKPLDCILKIVVPASPDCVCYSSTPDYTDNAYYVYRHALRTRNNLKHVWLVADDSLSGRMYSEFEKLVGNASDSSLRVVKRSSLKGYFLYLRSRILFHTHGVYAFSNWAFRRHVVNLWHGMPIKSIGKLNLTMPNPFHTVGTMHIATSIFFKYVMACAFDTAPSEVLICSLPRCEALKEKNVSNIKVDEIRHALSLPEHGNIVLWMPTYRKGIKPKDNKNNVRTFLDDIPESLLLSLDDAAEENRCAIVVKLHVKDPLNYIDKSLFFKNIRFIGSEQWQRSGIQLYDFIGMSSALISDISSVLIDYLVTDRPIGIFGFDEKTYTRNMTFPVDMLLKSKRFQHLTNADHIHSFFESVASGASAGVPVNDLSSILYEDFREDGSERILREVGL